MGNIVDKKVLQQIDDCIEKNRESMIRDLLELMRIPSVQSKAVESAPFGRECKRILEKTVELFINNGFESRISADNKYALSFSGGRGKTIGIFAHGDVVPADGDWLICKPFEPVIKGDYIFGRGCHDDKSGIIQALYAAKMIRDLGLPFESRLVMVTGSNEETGMADVISFSKNEKMPDVSLVLDGEYPYYRGEKSTMRFDMISKTQLKTVKDICGGKSYTTVLGEVKSELEYSDALY